MRLAEIMSSPVETVAVGESAEAAWERMRTAGVRHLVVLRGGEPAGVLSERDLGGRRGREVRRNRTVADLMSPEIVCASPRATVREAANMLRGRRIGCLPVLDGDRWVGIVTITDLLDLIGRGVERPMPRPPRRTRGARPWAMPRRGRR